MDGVPAMADAASDVEMEPMQVTDDEGDQGSWPCWKDDQVWNSWWDARTHWPGCSRWQGHMYYVKRMRLLALYNVECFHGFRGDKSV